MAKTTKWKRRTWGFFTMTGFVGGAGGFALSKEILDRYNPGGNNNLGAAVVGLICFGVVGWMSTKWLKEPSVQIIPKN